MIIFVFSEVTKPMIKTKIKLYRFPSWTKNLQRNYTFTTSYPGIRTKYQYQYNYQVSRDIDTLIIFPDFYYRSRPRYQLGSRKKKEPNCKVTRQTQRSEASGNPEDWKDQINFEKELKRLGQQITDRIGWKSAETGTGTDRQKKEKSRRPELWDQLTAYTRCWDRVPGRTDRKCLPPPNQMTEQELIWLTTIVTNSCIT